MSIPVRNIGSIKTKRSAGNNILIGSIAGVATAAILGAIAAEPDKPLLPTTEGDGVGAGAIIGLPPGAAIGWLTSLFKTQDII